ncbi:DNA-directed RNA polymerase subunit omega [candidate division KSB1 bacterium]|nr:DNA-directed RNA polymerase subunit omega [candidate division KSB1 bacterium]
MLPDTIDLRDLEDKSETIYEAVMIASRRARQIHEKITADMKKRLGEIENEEDLEEESVDREKIVREFDKRDKPSVIALQELIDGKLRRKAAEDSKEK